MCAASVLHSFGPSAMPGPVMPMDMAMRLYISHSPPPLRGFLSSYEELHRAKTRQQIYKPMRPPLRPCLSSSQQKKSVEARGNGDDGGGWSKKRVVFADSKGMSLTAIHVFSKFDDEPFAPRRSLFCEELQFDLLDLEGASAGGASGVRINAAAAAAARGSSLALDFKQPSADYLDFRNRLMRDSVCLESCSLQSCSLAGTVKVRNVGFAKAVTVRATFDAWASHTDVAGTFMNNVYGCPDADTFAFVLELPSGADEPQNGVEFCVLFQAEGRSYWDNNDGRNYVLKRVGWNGGEDPSHASSSRRPAAIPDRTKPSEQRTGGVGGCGGKLLDSSTLEFDQFGSPRMSSGLFPGWQSWGQVETSVPYW